MAVPLTTKILLADDHNVVRRGLRMVLEAAPDLTVVAEAEDGIEAVERGLREPVDLAVIDVAMPRRGGLEAARELLRHRPEMRVLMLSMHDVEEFCFEALKAGASGYVLKTVADKELVEACRAAMRGEPFLSPPTVATLMRAYLEDPDSRGGRGSHPLTPREREVVKLVAEAHTTEQIAALLQISPRTVERHRENILAKLGMRDRVELTRWAIRHGLIEP
jgi:DNA-binding NarL/FixJ family response regulator